MVDDGRDNLAKDQHPLTRTLNENYDELGEGHQESLKHNYGEVISAFRDSDEYTLGKDDVADAEFEGREKDAAAALNAMNEIGAISDISAGTYLNGYMDSEHNWKHFPDYFWEMLENSLDEVVLLQEKT